MVLRTGVGMRTGYDGRGVRHLLPGQSLPFPRRYADGLYSLRTVVDPLGQIVETDDLSNASVHTFLLHGRGRAPAGEPV